MPQTRMRCVTRVTRCHLPRSSRCLIHLDHAIIEPEPYPRQTTQGIPPIPPSHPPSVLAGLISTLARAPSPPSSSPVRQHRRQPFPPLVFPPHAPRPPTLDPPPSRPTAENRTHMVRPTARTALDVERRRARLKKFPPSFPNHSTEPMPNVDRRGARVPIRSRPTPLPSGLGTRGACVLTARPVDRTVGATVWVGRRVRRIR